MRTGPPSRGLRSVWVVPSLKLLPPKEIILHVADNNTSTRLACTLFHTASMHALDWTRLAGTLFSTTGTHWEHNSFSSTDTSECEHHVVSSTDTSARMHALSPMWETTFARLTHAGLGRPINEDNILPSMHDASLKSLCTQSGVGKSRKCCFPHGPSHDWHSSSFTRQAWTFFNKAGMHAL